MNRMKVTFFGLLLLTLAMTACRGGETGAAAELPDDVEMAVKEALSESTGVAVGQIEVLDVEKKEWPDACLGLAEEGEMCAQVITPGWQVTVRADGETYVFRTDEEGTTIRMED